MHALSILTYVPYNAHPDVVRRLPAALSSLDRSGYPGRVYVVDDGSTDPDHLRILDHVDGRFEVVHRRENGGVCRAKNTCIRVLLDAGVDVGFLAEDDVDFRPGWWERYLAAHRATGIEHFSWAWDDDPSGRMRKSMRVVNGFPVVKSSLVNGVLLTFTRNMIEEIGGFRILPGKWGHTHTNWTRRAVAAGLAPWFADVVDSNDVVGVNRYGLHSAVSNEDKARWEHENRPASLELSRLYEPLIEDVDSI